eukprot:s1562_g12.t3
MRVLQPRWPLRHLPAPQGFLRASRPMGLEEVLGQVMGELHQMHPRNQLPAVSHVPEDAVVNLVGCFAESQLEQVRLKYYGESNAANFAAMYWHAQNDHGLQPDESPEIVASFVSNSSTEEECHLTPGSILSVAGSGFFGHRRPALEVRSHEFRAMRCFERCCPYDRRRPHFEEQVVYAGFVVKCSRHLGRWRQRWAVLTPSCLKTFKEQQLCAKPTEDFQLQQVKHVAVQGSEVMLDLQSHRCTFRCPGPNVGLPHPHVLRACEGIAL